MYNIHMVIIYNIYMHTGRPGHKQNRNNRCTYLLIIQQTLETLSACNKRLKAKLDINLAHQGTLQIYQNIRSV